MNIARFSEAVRAGDADRACALLAAHIHGRGPVTPGLPAGASGREQ